MIIYGWLNCSTVNDDDAHLRAPMRQTVRAELLTKTMRI